MKTKGMLLATLSILGFSGAFAQAVEYDDMYFNADDRAALKAQTAIAYSAPEKNNKFDAVEDRESVNPTDSYSARNVNPEYTSRAQSQSAEAEEQDYFVTNYQYNRIQQLTNSNNSYNNWYNNQWYRSGYYGAGINSWNSPYYGYNGYSSPWYDPFWAYNGWSSSFSYSYGPSWNYGWGGSYNYWNRPFYGWDSYYGGGGWYGGGYWNNYMYPGTVIVINQNENNRRGVVYGRRPTRGTSMVSGRSSVRSRTDVNNSIRTDNSNGRTSSSGRQPEYYNRYHRSDGGSTSDYGSRSSTEYNRSRSWNNWDSNGGSNRSSSPSYSPSRTSSTMSSGSGTRTNSGGSTSGGRRGRD